MKKRNIVITIMLGVVCALFIGLSSWYTVVFNECRFIVPMDLSKYVFRMQDIPMIFSGILFMCYIMYLAVKLLKAIITSKRREMATQVTRKLNPKMGFLGLFGFCGFLGFWTYQIDKIIFPFVFFIFFGFFGFFYEGKLSNTFMDERYKENKIKANSLANKLTLTIVFLTTLIVGQGKLMGSLEYTFIAYIIIISLAMALELFLNEFLLYHYDHREEIEESEE